MTAKKDQEKEVEEVVVEKQDETPADIIRKAELGEVNSRLQKLEAQGAENNSLFQKLTTILETKTDEDETPKEKDGFISKALNELEELFFGKKEED